MRTFVRLVIAAMLLGTVACGEKSHDDNIEDENNVVNPGIGGGNTGGDNPSGGDDPDDEIGGASANIDGDFTPGDNVSADGYTQEVIEISNVKQFVDFAANSKKESYEGCLITLQSDIDLSEYDDISIATSWCTFRGYFDGNNKTISNYTNNTYEFYQGLFRVIGYGGAVVNLNIDNAIVGDIYAHDKVSFGALAGYNCGYVSGCKISNSTVTAGDAVGVIIGENCGTVTNCKAENSTAETLKTSEKDENIVGLNRGTIL